MSFYRFLLQNIKNLKKKIYIFMEWDSFFLLSFYLLVGLIPYRLSILFQVDPVIRYGVGIIFLLITFSFKGWIIPSILNHKVFQAYFFTLLDYNNYYAYLQYNVKNYPEKFWSSVIQIELFHAAFGYGPFLIIHSFLMDDIVLSLLVYFMIYSPYLIARRLFLAPNYEFSGLGKIESPAVQNLASITEFNWVSVVKNLNFVSVHFFSRPVTNKLSAKRSEQPLSFIAVRHVGSLKEGVKALFDAAKNSESSGSQKVIGAVIGSVATYFYTERNARVKEMEAQASMRSAEANMRSAEASMRNAEANMRSAEANLKNAEANLKNAEANEINARATEYKILIEKRDEYPKASEEWRALESSSLDHLKKNFLKVSPPDKTNWQHSAAERLAKSKSTKTEAVVESKVKATSLVDDSVSILFKKLYDVFVSMIY